jgi:hypothetical protein
MQSLFLRHAAAPAILGIGMIAAIGTLLLAVGAFSTLHLPRGFTSQRQLLGIDILLISLPSYLVFAWGLLHRRSAALLERVDALAPGGDFRRRLHTPTWVLAVGSGLGTIYAVAFNLPVASVDQLVEGGVLLTTLVALMILVWVAVGLVLSSRLYASSVFRDAGREVPVDLWDHTSLEPFARNGMGDFLLAMGGLVLSTVQSIDAMFRTENYLYALAIGIPAAAILLSRPMSTVHARLKAMKRDELANVNALIRTAPKTLSSDDIGRLEPLLQRRDRVQAISTWPLNMSMISRLLIYGVIPPAAWIGAALVELVVDRLVRG